MIIIRQPKWTTVNYSKNRIEKAGREIVTDSLSDEQKAEALEVVDNWRAAHAYPLQVIYMNLKRLSKGNNRIIVAQRLKRLDSIVGKLKRFNTMSLWKMQDLGGCRFVVPTIADVYKYRNLLEKSRIRHIHVGEDDDYIRSPKESGYRSLHAVYKYHSDKKTEFNRNMMIEIQFRTKLQHIWATAVETMGLFKNIDIKGGLGSTEVKRFFALTSSLFAIEEKCTTVPNTPDDIGEIIRELKKLDSEYNFLDFLSTIRVATKLEEGNKQDKKYAYCVLSLDYESHLITVRRFMPSEIDVANEYYSKLEMEKQGKKVNNVLVRVSSFSDLKSAYPNYFSDISDFVFKIKRYLRQLH